jgi:dephospho-CoA kinase
MYVVLLTGGLAAGKNTVAALLSARGATILDLDVIAKEIQIEQPILERLTDAFGYDIVCEDGSLDRALLAQRAFENSDTVATLNAICWPPIKQRVADFILGSTCQPMEKGSLLVVQIPLLVEAPDFIELADEVISVAADENLRLQRAVARGMNIADVRNRLALQASDEERAALSDTVFTNNDGLEALETQVREWYEDRIGSRLF